MKIPRIISSRQINQELGFGKHVTTAGRMMDPDGTFNVQRDYLSSWDNIYYHLVTMSWWKFFLLVFLVYQAINIFFAGVYTILGADQLQGLEGGNFWRNFTIAYFFSTQTLTTVGYGHISPVGWSANLVASLESFAGLLAFALISGLLYGRFSRPNAKIIFSPNLLVAPYKESKGLMFRMGNTLKSELIEVEVRIILAMNQADETGALVRRFYPLALEIDKVLFFSLSWTVVHALNEQSPLWSFSEQDLTDANAEFLILVKGVDEINQQTVHNRHSYHASEMIWGGRFQPVISRNAKGQPRVLSRQIGAYEMDSSTQIAG